MKVTKLMKVKRRLERGLSITQKQAIDLYNSYRLSSIIHTLRHKHDMDIETEEIYNKSTGSRFAKYKLKQVA